jgi:hypothetical protein
MFRALPHGGAGAFAAYAWKGICNVDDCHPARRWYNGRRRENISDFRTEQAVSQTETVLTRIMKYAAVFVFRERKDVLSTIWTINSRSPVSQSGSLRDRTRYEFSTDAFPHQVPFQ